MKKFTVAAGLLFVIAASSAFVGKWYAAEQPISIPASAQRSGDSAKGYNYLTTGDFLKSGVPYNYFLLINGKNKNNYLNRVGKNAFVDYGYNVVKAANDVDIVIPTCLQCHAEMFDGKLYVGLGNTSIDFSNISAQNNFANNAAVRFMQTVSPKQYDAAKAMIKAFQTTYPQLETEVRGVNAADRLAALLVAHRNNQTLEWTDDPVLDILTVKDSSEAREVNEHFGDVLAFIRSIQPPPYPKTIDNELAKEGEGIFINNCSKCHGTYGDNEYYPNLLIPGNSIQTDSLLYKSNQQNPQFVAWFNNSWFAKGDSPARLEPSNGYVAPPLDGVWVTAPYFHNGSVPTLEAVLNSKLRPKYWSRDFNNPQYNYDNPGWIYQSYDQPDGKKRYNTTLPGYGNGGHTYGDKLSQQERKALIEYLKTI